MNQPESRNKPQDGGTAATADESSEIQPPTQAPSPTVDAPREVGGYDGPEPTRFGDWEHNGRCTDF